MGMLSQFGRGSGVRRAAIVTMMAVALVVAGCSSSSAKYSDKVTSSEPFDNLIRPAVAISSTPKGPALRDGQVGVLPGRPIVITATMGRLTNVSIPTQAGRPLAGKFSDNNKVWTSAEPLGYGARYVATATATGIGGTVTTKQSFTTKAPNNVTQAYLQPANNTTVGVGQPVAVKFDTPIANRRAAQDAITVTTDPGVEGAFYWLSDSEVHWRPKDYWKPGTKVSVQVNIYGIDLGNGTFGQENVKSNFTVGDALIATADDKTKMITITRNGKVVKTMPTSMGKDGTPTDNGVYIVNERLDFMIMDSSTYGVPVNSADGYRTPVNYATRMSQSGIFVHAAPWSMWAQGNTNTSHGCLNVSPENAKWFMDNTKFGDLVVVKNTNAGVLPGTDGLGDWNIPWSVWSKGNADG